MYFILTGIFKSYGDSKVRAKMQPSTVLPLASTLTPADLAAASLCYLMNHYLFCDARISSRSSLNGKSATICEICDAVICKVRVTCMSVYRVVSCSDVGEQRNLALPVEIWLVHEECR